MHINTSVASNPVWVQALSVIISKKVLTDDGDRISPGFKM